LDEEIVLVEKKLNELGIFKYSDGVEWTNTAFVENEARIKEIIIENYLKNKRNYDLPIDAIGVDATSAVRTYALRGNNKARLFKDAKCFYVSNNRSFISAVRQYNDDNYPKTVSPIIDVNLVGLIVCSEYPQKVSDIARNRMLAFCNHHFSPSKKVRDKFNRMLVEQKNKSNLTDIQYLQLTNETTVASHLYNVTKNDADNVTEETPFFVLERIKGDYVIDVKNSYEQKIEEINNEHDNELKNKAEENKSIKVSYAKREYAKWKFGIISIYYFIFTALFLGTVTSTVFSFISGWNKSVNILWGIIPSLAFTIISIFFFFFGWRKRLLNYFLIKRKNKVAKKHGVEPDLL
jgi:hypothetical protein